MDFNAYCFSFWNQSLTSSFISLIRVQWVLHTNLFERRQLSGLFLCKALEHGFESVVMLLRLQLEHLNPIVYL
jgi:hypothetical protein